MIEPQRLLTDEEIKGVISNNQDLALYNILVNAVNRKIEVNKIWVILRYQRTYNYSYKKVKIFIELMHEMGYNDKQINDILKVYNIKNEQERISKIVL